MAQNVAAAKGMPAHAAHYAAPSAQHMPQHNPLMQQHTMLSPQALAAAQAAQAQAQAQAQVGQQPAQAAAVVAAQGQAPTPPYAAYKAPAGMLVTSPHQLHSPAQAAAAIPATANQPMTALGGTAQGALQTQQMQLLQQLQVNFLFGNFHMRFRFRAFV